MQLTGVIPKLTSSNSCGIPDPILLKKKKKKFFFKFLFVKKKKKKKNSYTIYQLNSRE